MIAPCMGLKGNYYYTNNDDNVWYGNVKEMHVMTIFVDHCLATNVFTGKLLAAGWV